MDDDESVLDDNDWSEYESGPFCFHWSDPSDCDELCRCGHKCCKHLSGGCNVEGCVCEDFEDTKED
jgi:hypothetical protein